MSRDSFLLELLDKICACSGARWVAVAFKETNGTWQRYLRGRDPVLPQVEQAFFRELEQCGNSFDALPSRGSQFTTKWKANTALYRWFRTAADQPAYYCYLSTRARDEAQEPPAEWIELLLQSAVTAAAERARTRFEIPRRQAVLESAISMLQASREEELIPRWLDLALRITGADGAACYDALGESIAARHVSAQSDLKAALLHPALPLRELLELALRTGEAQRRTRSRINSAEHADQPLVPGESIALPLGTGTDTRMALVVVRRQFTEAGEMDLHLLGLFARQLASMLENLRLVERLRSANRELSEAQARLVESVRLEALGEVAVRVAHDVNNVLGALLGRIQLLQYSVTDPATLTGLAKMEALVGDGEATVRRLQEAARIDTEAESSKKSLDCLVREVFINSEYALRQQSQIHDRKQVWTTDFSPTGPVSGAAGGLEGALRRLLIDLPENIASDARIHVRTSRVGHANRLSLRIQSDPPPHAAALEAMPAVSLLRVLVDPLGGVVTLTDEPDALMLSLSFGAEHEGETSVRGAHGPAYRVLVVDDDDAVRDVLEELLRTEGHEVTVAKDGREALRLCSSMPFDLVFTDLGMPGMSGWELAESIKRNIPDLPVVMITGWGAQVDPERLQDSGVDRVLSKPFRWPAVRDTIDGLMRGVRS